MQLFTSDGEQRDVRRREQTTEMIFHFCLKIKGGERKRGCNKNAFMCISTNNLVVEDISFGLESKLMCEICLKTLSSPKQMNIRSITHKKIS